MMAVMAASGKPYTHRIRVALANYQHAVDYIRTTYGTVPVTVVEEGTFIVAVHFTPKEDN